MKLHLPGGCLPLDSPMILRYMDTHLREVTFTDLRLFPFYISPFSREFASSEEHIF